MLEFGMPTLIENRTLEENIALCRRLQLGFIELNMNFPEFQIENLENLERFVSAAENAGVFFTIHLDENLNIADFNRLVSDAYLETVRRTILAAKRMICLRDRFGMLRLPLTINMHMNHGVHITLPEKKVWMFERDFNLYQAAFISFRNRCEEWIGDADLKIVIENTDGFTEYEKQMIDYLISSPRFGLTWDIGHSAAAGETDLPFIMEHRDSLCQFHIHDGSAPSGKSHLVLGEGEIDLGERLKLASELNTRCVLETKTISALEKSVVYLLNRGYLN